MQEALLQAREQNVGSYLPTLSGSKNFFHMFRGCLQTDAKVSHPTEIANTFGDFYAKLYDLVVTQRTGQD